MQKSEVFVEVTPDSIRKYMEVIEECGDRFIEPGAGGKLLFKQRGHGVLEYMPFQGWTITQTFIPDSGARDNFSPEDLRNFLTTREMIEQEARKALHPVGPENCFKPDYEIHLNPFWDMGSESMKPGQVIPITEDQFKIIELFSNTKKDENLNTIYTLNDASFQIFPKFVK